jgi:hypothetical protein
MILSSSSAQGGLVESDEGAQQQQQQQEEQHHGTHRWDGSRLQGDEVDPDEQLSSPFLVKLHHSFQTVDKLCFVMDYINGGVCARCEPMHDAPSGADARDRPHMHTTHAHTQPPFYSDDVQLMCTS